MLRAVFAIDERDAKQSLGCRAHLNRHIGTVIYKNRVFHHPGEGLHRLDFGGLLVGQIQPFFIREELSAALDVEEIEGHLSAPIHEGGSA